MSRLTGFSVGHFVGLHGWFQLKWQEFSDTPVQVYSALACCCSHSDTSPTHSPRFQTFFIIELKVLSKPSAYNRNTFLVKCYFFPHKPSSTPRASHTLGMFACTLLNMNANLILTSTVTFHSLFLNRKFINCYITDMQQRPGPSSNSLFYKSRCRQSIHQLGRNLCTSPGILGCFSPTTMLGIKSMLILFMASDHRVYSNLWQL